MLQIDLMDLLVCEVYAQLLETIVIEDLETVDVQQFYDLQVGGVAVGLVQTGVELAYQPVEEGFVHGLCD